MTISIRPFATAALCLLLTSCDNYLELEHRSVPDEEYFYKTSQDALVATNAAYNPLLSIYRGDNGLWLLTEVSSDNTDDTNVGIDNLTMGTTDGSVSIAWQNHYLGIARCNTVLNRLPGITMDEALRNRLMLEARFLRGFYYFNLVRLFGSIPLIISEVDDLQQQHLRTFPHRHQ